MRSRGEKRAARFSASLSKWCSNGDRIRSPRFVRVSTYYSGKEHLIPRSVLRASQLENKEGIESWDVRAGTSSASSTLEDHDGNGKQRKRAIRGKKARPDVGEQAKGLRARGGKVRTASWQTEKCMEITTLPSERTFQGGGKRKGESS